MVCLATLFSGIVCWREGVLFRLESLASGRRASGEGAAALADAEALERQCLLPCRDRAVLGLASLRLTLASRAATPQARDRLLGTADAELSRLVERRPGQASGLVLLAAARQRGAGTQAETRSILARSYEAAPFLHEEGPWRVRVLAAEWPDVPPDLRRRVLDEAEWLLLVRSPEADSVAAALRRTRATLPAPAPVPGDANASSSPS